jgi:hypothetical protein
MAYTQVFDLYGGRLIGYLGDLTLLGAMVIGDKDLPPNHRVTLAIELPELPNVKATRMTLPARVVWCDQDLSPEYFDIGFEFQEVKPEQQELIRSLVEQYEFRRDVPSYQIRPPSNARE